MGRSVYDFQCTTIDGENQSLSEFQGKALLIVNTASKCGFTPQFRELEALYKKYADKGLEILGFPCNQFAHQDPGNNAEINEFCQLKYGVSFPMFGKIDVNGDNADPLFKHLSSQSKGLMGSQRIKWNFTKFLVDGSGKVIKRFALATKPSALDSQISKLLDAQ